MTAGATSVEGLDEGMRALLAHRAEELAAGAKPIGWKVGLNGPAVQAIFGLDSLVVGSLTTTTLLNDGAVVDVGDWSAPALEVEVALRVGADGGIAAVAPALELVNLNLPFDCLEPILAGNVFHQGVIFGTELPPTALDEGLEVVVRSQGDGAELARASLADDLGLTLEAVRTFLSDHGAALEPGQYVIAGSITPPLPMSAGNAVTVDFGQLGTLEVTFTAAAVGT